MSCGLDWLSLHPLYGKVLELLAEILFQWQSHLNKILVKYYDASHREQI